RLFPVEPARQLRMGRRLLKALRRGPCRLRHPEAHAQAQRLVLPRGHRAERGGLTVVSTGASPSEAERRDLFSAISCQIVERRSLRSALRAPVETTEVADIAWRLWSTRWQHWDRKRHMKIRTHADI